MRFSKEKRFTKIWALESPLISGSMPSPHGFSTAVNKKNSQDFGCETPGITGFCGSNESWSSHNMLWCPNTSPTMIHCRLVGHSIVRLQFHRIVCWWWSIGTKDLRRTRVWTVFHATCNEAGTWWGTSL